MDRRQFELRDARRGVALTIKVVPRAKKNEIQEIMADGTLKIRLKAPPVDGKANQALIEFLAVTFGVPKSSIEIIAGFSGRKKIVSIEDVDKKFIEGRLEIILN